MSNQLLFMSLSMKLLTLEVNKAGLLSSFDNGWSQMFSHQTTFMVDQYLML